ncbi:MAG: tetratricopeptide repeat protein [Vicinamibacteria bacterium]
MGALLPLADGGFLDLAQGRQISDTGRPAPPDTVLSPGIAEKTGGWLGSWILFQIHRLGGELGLRVLAAACMGGGALLLFLVRPGGVGFVTACGAVSLAATTLDLSTFLFSWPLLSAVVLCLTTLREKNKWLLLLLLVPLSAWPFLNRDALLGLALAGLAVLTFLIRAITLARRAEPEKRWVVFQEPLILIGVGVVTTVLISVSPQAWQNIENPFTEIALLQQAGISVWNPVSVREDTLFFVLATVTGLLALATPPLVMPLETLAMGSFLVLSLFSRHLVLFFAAVAMPPSSRSLTALAEKIPPSRRRLLGALTSPAAALTVGIALVLPNATTPPPEHPFQAVMSFITEHGLERPTFNVPSSGGLASWRHGSEFAPLAYLRPESLEAFEREIVSRRLAQTLENHDLDFVLVDRDFAHRAKAQLAEIPDLKLLFFDDTALLFAQEADGGRLSDLTFRYFDPLEIPSDYPPETVPLAIQELFEHYDRYPPSAKTLWKLGRLLLRAERREEALEAFEAAHRLDPDELRTLRALSRLYIDKGMYRLAEKAVRQALSFTRDEEFAYNLALALYGQGRFADASRQFERVLKLNEENLKARRALVDLYRQLGQLEKSYLQKETLTAMEESKTSALLSKAQERYEVLDFEEAAHFYERALDVRRDQPEVLWDLAMILLTDNRTEAAMAVLRELLEVAPRHSDARLTLGVLCARETNCSAEESGTHLEAFLILAPNDPNAELAKQELENRE